MNYSQYRKLFLYSTLHTSHAARFFSPWDATFISVLLLKFELPTPTHPRAATTVST